MTCWIVSCSTGQSVCRRSDLLLSLSSNLSFDLLSIVGHGYPDTTLFLDHLVGRQICHQRRHHIRCSQYYISHRDPPGVNMSFSAHVL